MPSCFVCARSRTSLIKLQNITFHRCSSHFDQNLFIENKSYRTLSKTTVPNIIISRKKSVSTSKIDSETSDKEFPQLDVATNCFNKNRSIQVSANYSMS